MTDKRYTEEFKVEAIKQITERKKMHGRLNRCIIAKAMTAASDTPLF